ncbi:Lrp/AsnC family transcriptional regulator [Rhodococcus sp. NM-2]|uniref:Lrp/AsnC family transcriptional regulator n=1 Tax=Rhodococcus sp. NM-2 TaxID=3401174 RepID=UPI003AB03572
MDELDASLIALLLEDGRMSNRELAAATGTTNATAGARVKRLVHDRVLVFTVLFDWEAAGYDWFVIAKIHVEGRSPNDVADDLAQLPACEVVAIVFGDVEVIAYFLVANRTELHELIEEQLGKIPGIGTMTMDLATKSTVTALGRQFFLARNAPPIRLPNPVIELDDLDGSILQELVNDGRQSSRNIARQLEVSEGTVRARIQRMVSAGLMRVVAMVEPLALGMVGLIANVGLKVDRDAIASVASVVGKLPQTMFMAVTVGSVDISIAIAARDQHDMLDTVLNKLRALEGVRSTETLQMIDVVRFAPYLKRLE